jgi:hypothetical protein
MSSEQEIHEAVDVMLREWEQATDGGFKGIICHEVTRRRDLAMDGKNLFADEAYFRSAVTEWNRVRHNPLYAKMMIFITVGGYDDDPRPL